MNRLVIVVVCMWSFMALQAEHPLIVAASRSVPTFLIGCAYGFLTYKGDSDVQLRMPSALNYAIEGFDYYKIHPLSKIVKPYYIQRDKASWFDVTDSEGNVALWSVAEKEKMFDRYKVITNLYLLDLRDMRKHFALWLIPSCAIRGASFSAGSTLGSRVRRFFTRPLQNQ